MSEQMSPNMILATIAIVTTTSMGTTWFQTGLTGTAKFTNVGIAGVVTAAVMVIAFAALEKLGSPAS
jgi:hypothetical protein